MEVIVGLIVIVVVVFVIRAFGAWMLRIDDVIELQREQTKLLRNISENIQNKIHSDDEIFNRQ
jgi:NhaP-type Na+/H+ or K+/H+ antiporter